MTLEGILNFFGGRFWRMFFILATQHLTGRRPEVKPAAASRLRSISPIWNRRA